LLVYRIDPQNFDHTNVAYLTHCAMRSEIYASVRNRSATSSSAFATTGLSAPMGGDDLLNANGAVPYSLSEKASAGVGFQTRVVSTVHTTSTTVLQVIIYY
jgi:hypothetical protein